MTNIASIEPVGERTVATNKGELRSEVSSQWWNRPDDEKFLSLSELAAYTKKRADESQADVIRNRDIAFVAPAEVSGIEDTYPLHVGLPTGDLVTPSHWSFGQLCTLAKAPAGYLRTLPSQLVADNLTWGYRRNREAEDVKAYYRPNADLRAITGPDYGRITDYEVVQAVRNIAGDGTGDTNWKVPGVMNWGSNSYNPHVDITKETTTLFASDRDVFLFLVDDLHPIEIGKLPNGDPDLIFRGFYVWNSEVGSRSLGIATFYLRGVCQNRLLWGVEGFKELILRHSKNAPDRFVYEANPALESFAEGSTQRLLEGVTAAKEAKIAKDDDEALQFLNNRGFSRSKSREILSTIEEEEGRKGRTAWDFAQGITAVARKVPQQDTRLTFERTAQKILDKVA